MLASLLAGALVIRGMGIGSSMMPAMAGASAALRGADTARAMSSINAIQRVGGSLGVALAFVPAAFLPRKPTGAKTRQRAPIGQAPGDIASAAGHI